jgi:hypothetical protein
VSKSLSPSPRLPAFAVERGRGGVVVALEAPQWAITRKLKEAFGDSLYKDNV